MIRKAFKITGITTKANGSENHLIKLPEHYAELFYVEENNNENIDELLFLEKLISNNLEK
jgi:hypothetical protein